MTCAPLSLGSVVAVFVGEEGAADEDDSAVVFPGLIMTIEGVVVVVVVDVVCSCSLSLSPSISIFS